MRLSQSAINTKYWLSVLRLKHELKLIRQRIVESGLIMRDKPTWTWDGLVLTGYQAHVVPPRGLPSTQYSYPDLPFVKPAFKGQYNKNRYWLGVLEVILKGWTQDWEKDYNGCDPKFAHEWNVPPGWSISDVERQHATLKYHQASLNFYFSRTISLRLYYWGDPTIVIPT